MLEVLVDVPIVDLFVTWAVHHFSVFIILIVIIAIIIVILILDHLSCLQITHDESVSTRGFGLDLPLARAALRTRALSAHCVPSTFTLSCGYRLTASGLHLCFVDLLDLIIALTFITSIITSITIAIIIEIELLHDSSSACDINLWQC